MAAFPDGTVVPYTSDSDDGPDDDFETAVVMSISDAVADSERRGGGGDGGLGPGINLPPPDNHVMFHCLIDPRLMREGETLALRGDLPVLGEWDEPIPMVQSPFNPNIWSVRVEMPYRVAGARPRNFRNPYFSFKYSIEGADSHLLEGLNNRNETKLLRHYYHTFRQDYRNRERRYIGRAQVDDVVDFTTDELEHVINKASEPADFFERFDAIANCCNARRSEAEDIFDQYLETRRELFDDPFNHLIFLGMIGQFGLSSKDPLQMKRTPVATGGAGGRAGGSSVWGTGVRRTGAAGGYRYTYTRKEEPEKPWSIFTLNNLPVELVCQIKIYGVFGSRGSWAVRGVTESVERAANAGSFSWLRVMPFVEKHRQRPTIKLSKLKDGYSEMALSLRGLANECMAQAMAEIAERPEPEEGDAPPPEPASLTLARSYFGCIIKYAPTIGDLVGLFDEEFRMHAEMLLDNFARKVQDFVFRKPDEFDALYNLIAGIPQFQAPEVASAILRNSDGDDFQSRVLQLVTMCTSTPLSTPGPADQEPPEKLKDLAEAAKDWFRRSHAHEPEYSTGHGTMTASQWRASQNRTGGRGRQVVKPPTEEELLQQRKEAMVNGIDAADALLRIPYFAAQREQATLFELGRCHFFKGDSKAVLGAMLAVLAADVVNRYVNPTVVWLGLKAKVLVEETVMDEDISQREVIRMLNVITGSLERGHHLSAQLLHALAASISTPTRTNPALPPTLLSVLSWHMVWRQIYAYTGTDPTQWQNGTQLGNLLLAVYERLTSTAVDIQTGVVTLDALHVVLTHEQPFLDLLNLVGVVDVTPQTLDDCRAPLLEFDSTLEKVQCYVSFFCGSSTIKIEDSQLRELVSNLTSGYNGLTLRAVLEGLFSNVECLDDIPWLFALKQSELFFALWRSIGKSLARERWIAENTPTETVDGADELPGGGLFDDLEGEGDDAAGPAEVPTVEPTDADLETIILSQTEVHDVLIPAVREQWTGLMNSVRDRSITINRLQETFATLKSKDDIAAELQFLAETGDGPNSNADTNWVPGALPQLHDYHLLIQLARHIPAILNLAGMVGTLLGTEAKKEEDNFLEVLDTAYAEIQAHWDAQTLATLSILVLPVKPLLDGYKSDLLEFVSAMAESPSLVQWLIEHDSTDEFNRLLQVCRPCTDEPVLISSIASLVHIRTILVPLLYTGPPYADTKAFLNAFQEVEFDGDAALRHLSNVVANFEGLLDVFEKQTRSPGIVSCYELKAISERGTMVFTVGDEEASILSLQLASEAAGGRVKSEPLEYLLDLRSKLLMTEIPEELNDEFPITDILASFVDQLQVLVEMRDTLFSLYTSGHFAYREGLTRSYPFAVDGLDDLKAALAELHREMDEWRAVVKAAREKHYYLNFLSMRELQRLNEALSGAGRYSADAEAAVADEIPPETPTPTGDNAFGEVLPPWECVHCYKENEGSHRMCVQCSKPRLVDDAFGSSGDAGKDALDAQLQAAEEEAARERRRARRKAATRVKPDATKDISSLLYLCSSSLPTGAVGTCRDAFAAAHSGDSVSTEGVPPVEILEALGTALGAVFGGHGDDGRPEGPPYRGIPLPGQNAAHRADLLVSIDAEAQKGEHSLPVFVSATDTPNQVIDAVLSVYVRRGRLPEPGEILFCTGHTTIEDVDLLLRRFCGAKPHGYGDNVFCIADVHNLSYAKQCLVVDRLRKVLDEYGTAAAATLLFVSGRPNQVLLNSLSSQYMDLPPLEERELQKACMRAFEIHGTETIVVSSDINGGGKTHYIQSLVADRQHAESPDLLYRRLPFRESSDAGSLMALLRQYDRPEPTAFHLDIGHIIPAVANTVLFQLLIVGTLRDPNLANVYHRRDADVFLIEVPNSIGNRTGKALRLCTFIPAKRLEVGVVDLRKPIFTDDECTRITRREYSELIMTCQYLRAYRMNKFQGTEQDMEWNIMTCEPIGPDECFALLLSFTARDDMRPSYLIFNNFCLFMHQMFTNMDMYPIMSAFILVNTEGLQDFKQVFMTLLIEVSKDFALRSVPQIADIGFTSDDVFVPTPSPAQGGSADFPAVTASSMANVAAGGSGAGSATSPGAPPLKRGASVTLLEAAQLNRIARAADPEALDEMNMDNVARFQSMSLWEASDHPIVLFYRNQAGAEISGIDMISTNSAYVDDYIRHDMKAVLQANGIDLNKDWKDLSNDSAIEIMLKVNGFMGTSTAIVDPSYVITVDNLLKMLSIMMRMMYQLPVVISGETGCGKSSLINTLCAVLGAELRTLNIHGGMNDDTIRDWMYDRLDEAERMRGPTDQLVVFFDEINTCNSMGLFKEMVCDGSMDGKPLHDKIKIIAACNPYRLKKETNREDDMSAGLVFEHHAGGLTPNDDNVGTGIHDPLSKLVYRVHPLPESMTDLVFDFGSLSPDTERLYIKAILLRNVGVYIPPELRRMTKNEQMAGEIEATIRAQLGEQATMEQGLHAFSMPRLTPFGEFVEVFAELICASQEFVRDLYGGERAAVSLRDVARCIKVYRWFGEHFADSATNWTLEDFFAVKPAAQPYVRRAVFLSLAYCFHARLSREERRQYRACLAGTWADLQKGPNFTGSRVHWWARIQKAKCTWLKLDAKAFNTVLLEAQRSFVSHMNVGDGIALNEALCENLFMILVSVLNAIPIFVIGKPGSSKSLAMELVQSNLNGDASENEFLRSLPAVEVFSYQCSPLSTSEGIESVFDTARRYKRESSNTVVVVLLDEVGLAEQSPHLPLKVLHKVLDEGGAGESLVGISNWALDPAKMNRAVHLYRPAPTVEDLSETAMGMTRSVNLKGYLQSLAQSYSIVYHGQEHADFWGLREFYSTVRFINRSLESNDTVNPEMLITAVLRNFGGRPSETEKVVSTFFDRMGLVPPKTRPDVVELVRQNIREVEARHLMLLTKNNAALGLLFDKNLLDLDHTEVIFGSDFPDDQTDLQVALNIQRVKLCMAEGVTIALVHCESLYESLYDLLNQHYCEYGGQLYVRLAFGTHSRLCPIHRSFRVVVVVDKIEAYTRLAPPLLNRFEKQVMERQHMLNPIQRRIVARLRRFACGFANADALTAEEEPDFDDENADAHAAAEAARTPLSVLSAAFCGYHADLLSSLALAVVPEDTEPDAATLDGLFAECVDQLLWVAAPEAAVKVLNTDHGRALTEASGLDAGLMYFKGQIHSSLPVFLDSHLASMGDELGSQVVIMTYAPLALNAAEVIRHQSSWSNVTHTALHELSSERDLVEKVKTFFEEATDGSVLFVQCDPLAASLRRIEHAKYVCENTRSRAFRHLVDDVIAKAPEGGFAEPAEGEVAPARGVHVVFLLHLPRHQQLSFAFDFDKRWRNVFVDSIEPATFTGMPDVDTLIGKPFIEIMASLNLKVVLAHNFRLALSRLVYPYERTNDNVRTQIVTLLAHFEDADFMVAVQDIINSIVEQSHMDIDLTSAAQDERELSLAGTFRAAMHRQIVEAAAGMFAIVLGHMERDSNLQLYTEPSLRALWLHLLHRSFEDMSVLQMSRVTDSLGDGAGAGAGAGGSSAKSSRRKGRGASVEVRADGTKGAAFNARFPFSFFLSRILESLRSVAETSGGSATDSLQQQFALVNIGEGLDGELEPELISRYVYDYVCMHAPNSEVLDKAAQARVVERVLSLAEPEVPLNKLSAVHGRYWVQEATLDAYFNLVDAVPSVRSDVVQYIMGGVEGLGGELHLGLVRIVMAALSPDNQTWDDVAAYSGWMAQVELAKNTVASLLDWAATDLGRDAVDAIRADWDKLIFFYTFVRDVAVPLAIPTELSQETLKALGSVELSTQAAYRTLVRLLSDLNREWARLGTEMECAICYSIPTNPVRFCGIETCQRIVCRSCVDSYMASETYLNDEHRCFWCRTANAPGPVVREEDIRLVESCAGKEERLRAAAGRFMEFFIFDYCFAPGPGGAEKSLDTGLLSDFVVLLAGRTPAFADEEQAKYFIDVVPSDAGKVALLRCLLGIQSPETAAAVTGLINDELVRGVNESGHLDTALCVLWSTVYEETLAESLDESNVAAVVAAVAAVDTAALSAPTEGDAASSLSADAVRTALQAVATMRRGLTTYANLLCDVLDSSSTDSAAAGDNNTAGDDGESAVDSAAAADVAALEAAINPVLSAPASEAGIAHSIQRSMRVFLLKNLERRRGVGFVRSALQQPPLADAPWLAEWKDSGETGLVRFLGTNKLPRHNPFTRVPLFAEFDGVISNLLVTGDTAELGSLLTSYAGSSQAKGALVAALFHEVFLLNVLPDYESGPLPEKVAKLRAFIRESDALASYTAVERRIVSIFAGDVVTADDGEDVAQALGQFVLTPASSPEKIVVTRFLAHVAVVALSCTDSNYAGVLGSLITRPGQMADAYLPTMPEDIQFMAQNVLGGRWYKCPNGHSYYVDACGRPTEILTCATCGEQIGGTDHNLLDTNIDTNEVGSELYQKTVFEDTTSRGYCLREAAVEAEDPYFAVRTMTATSVRATRLIMHASLLLGSAAGGAEWAAAADALFNRTYCDPASPALFFSEHFDADWAQCRRNLGRSDDDLSLLLHDILLSFAADVTATVPKMTTPDERLAWETRVASTHIFPRVDTDGLGDRLVEIYAKYGGDDDAEGNLFTSELLEMFDPNAMALAQRRAAVPTLWIYRRPFSLESFTMQLQLSADTADRHPVLAEFLATEVQLRALRYMAGLLAFPELVLTRYNRRIDVEAARNMTVADVFAELPEHEAGKWAVAFDDYANAWNGSWRFVERFGCLRIPASFANMRMSMDTPLSFCLIGEGDEGICPLALIRFLVEKHNMFVERVDELLLLRGREMQRSGGRQAVVQSRFFTPAHSLAYDLDSDFLPYVEKQCVQYSASGDLLYDFGAAEQFLLDRFFGGKPLIELELKMFEYISEGSAVQNILSLGQKMEQVPLKHDVVTAISAEITSPAVAHKYIELVETVVSFLLATGGSFATRLDDAVAELMLDDYTRNVLLIEDATWGRAVSENVQLKHLDALWTVLQSHTNTGPLDTVLPMYRAELEDGAAAALASAAENLDLEKLLPAMQKVYAASLSGDAISAKSPLKDFVGYVIIDDQFAVDIDWFSHFPADIPCSQAVAAYELLESLLE